MTPDPQPQARFRRLRELVVPAIMIAGTGFYGYDALHLSATALIFPGALILVIAAALLWPIAAALTGTGEAPAANEEGLGPMLDKRPWALVILPVLLFLVFDYLGAFIALAALVYGAQLIFSARTPLKSFLITIAVTVPIYALFKYILYVRFPLGIFGIG